MLIILFFIYHTYYIPIYKIFLQGGTMIFLAIAYVLIIAGFVLVYARKKIKKENPGLKVAKITGIQKTGDGYEMTIKYSFDEGVTFLEETIWSSKKRSIGEDIIIQIMDDGSVELYIEDKMISFASIGCWILGILILCFFCK